MSAGELVGWDRLRHGGLLLDPKRAGRFADEVRPPVGSYNERELRQMVAALPETRADIAAFARFVLEEICGFTNGNGTWTRGPDVDSSWGRRGLGGELIKPRAMWKGTDGARLPVFFDNESRIGVGRGKKAASQVVQWLRAGSERLAVLTNGKGWRLVFAALDADAWCEWDADLWFEEGQLSPQVACLRILLSPKQWTPLTKGAAPPLAQAILDSRKGQADLSAALGERVREAVEILVQAHGDVLKRDCAASEPSAIYRAAVRIVMRMVVVLFAESRDLLPRDNALYHGSYGLGGLLSELEKVGARGANRLARSHNAWPRVLALFRLVHAGSHHPALPVPAYGGELFAPGETSSYEGLQKALAVFESACFDQDLLSDRDVHRMLERLTRTRVKIRQGHASSWVSAPVDFSDLSSEYIGILYEGLLDFELKTAPAGDPVVFLGVGNQPALPLSRLEMMDDKALASLLDKMKATSEAADDEEDGDAAVPDGDEQDVDEAAEETAAVVVEEADARQATRTRAETWARHAAEAGKLVRKPKAPITPEKQRKYEEDLGAKALQLVTHVVLAGEWYLVRWGGTRKGSGTFYTRPRLAVPTVRRTLRPLAYTPPNGADGGPNIDAPAAEWAPRTPEEILSITVCDPACGSGTFPVAALRFLTDALYAAHHHHGRAMPADGDELRFKALLRRQVVERCIYGVDIDPLAVELCRLALWIETMDRTLPFSFLDHKIKAGNSLIGAWFDTFQHYPVMAWKNRDGGDKSHSNGVHFKQGARTKAIKAFVKDRLTPDLQTFLRGPTLFNDDLQETAARAHASMLATLSRVHALPVHASADRARVYREELLGSREYQALKSAMDLWCACWFWPVDELSDAPLPTTLMAPSNETREAASVVSSSQRFFHWELEFPDVFHDDQTGFDAILGNPPWETLQPNSKEFFSNVDPLFRSYGKREALDRQARYFAAADMELRWLDYCAGFANSTNWMKCSVSPFGDPRGGSRDVFPIAKGKSNEDVHDRWQRSRSHSRGFVDGQHPFKYCGDGKAYTYKLFIEQAYCLLRPDGRMGLIIPSGLYSDPGSADLRRLLLDHCEWEWLFGFENLDGIFQIHRSFKFAAIVVEKGGTTDAIRTAFMRRVLEDWEIGEQFAALYSRNQLERFSPKSLVLMEFGSTRDIEVMNRASKTGTYLSYELSRCAWSVRGTSQGDLNLTSEVNRVWHAASGQVRACTRIGDVGLYLSGKLVAFPVIQGAMMHQMHPLFGGYESGFGHETKWRQLDWDCVTPQFWAPVEILKREAWCDVRLACRRVANSTDERSMIAALLPLVPCSDTTLVFDLAQPTVRNALSLVAILDSFVFDWLIRQRIARVTALGFDRLQELPMPSDVFQSAWRRVARCACRLNLCHRMFARQWLELREVLDLPAPVRGYARTPAERIRVRCAMDAAIAVLYGLDREHLAYVLRDVDHPANLLRSLDVTRAFAQKGFWRVDKGSDPELRHTVLTLVAFADLAKRIEAAGDLEQGLEVFLNQNDGQGWMLPETLRLADYGLGHDDRARRSQPVASRFGPRFFDWQLAQTTEESWRECELHARNIAAQTTRSTPASEASQAPAPGKARPKASSFLPPDGDE